MYVDKWNSMYKNSIWKFTSYFNLRLIWNTQLQFPFLEGEGTNRELSLSITIFYHNTKPNLPEYNPYYDSGISVSAVVAQYEKFLI